MIVPHLLWKTGFMRLKNFPSLILKENSEISINYRAQSPQAPAKVLALVLAVHPDVVLLDLQTNDPMNFKLLRKI